MNSNTGRKGKRVSASPSQSPVNSSSPLPKIKLNVRPSTPQPMSRPSSSTGQPRGAASDQRRVPPSDPSSSELTPVELDDDETEPEDFAPASASRKGKKRDSVSFAPASTPKDKGKGKAVPPPPPFPQQDKQARPSPSGPNGRQRKRIIKLGEVARRRARDDKFGFGGADRFSSVTPTLSGATSTLIDSDSTSSYGDDESEPENANSLLIDDDETDDEVTAGLPEAFAGQEIEDLQYGAPQVGWTQEQEIGGRGWWQEEEDDEELVAQLTGSDIEGLQTQSSAAGSDSDDPMSDSDSTSDTDDGRDEFGFPLPFGASNNAPSSDAPLILMENWDGQFVLVQPRNDRSRSRRGNRGSQSAASIGESTSASAGEQQLIIDADAETDDSTDWSDGEDDGGDTTDSMAEEDMPVLESSALDELVGFNTAAAPSPNPFHVPSLSASGMALDNGLMDMELSNPSIVVTDTSVQTPALSTTSSASAGPSATGTPGSTIPTPATPVAAIAPPVAPPAAPVMGTFPAMGNFPVMGTFPAMGTFHVTEDHNCAHAVIDGTKKTTKSPFTRRRRHKASDSMSISSKRSSSRRPSLDPCSPVTAKKLRYSSIPGHPRYIAARRAAQPLVDPMDRENTPTDDEAAFSLEDMLDSSMLHMNESAVEPQDEQELRHLYRFDKVPVSMYMRRNFHKRAAAGNSFGSSNMGGFGRGNNSVAALTDTLAAPLPQGASRMLISPILAPTPSNDYNDGPLSRKDRRRARRRDEGMQPLHI